jgi:peptidylprolyl isomerase
MTIATTSIRSTFFTTVTAAVLFSLVILAGARGASPGQEDAGKGKTMNKTESGLKYTDEKVGTGDTPKTGQTCLVHYTGWIWEKDAKGKEFDSSIKRNAPFAFPVGEGKVIKGWDEGVSTMKVGGIEALAVVRFRPTPLCSTKSSYWAFSRKPTADSNTATSRRGLDQRRKPARRV